MRLPAGLRVNLDVTIALSTLAGCDDLSARLTGLGVTADTARALAQVAGTLRILLTNDPPHPPHSQHHSTAAPAPPTTAASTTTQPTAAPSWTSAAPPTAHPPPSSTASTPETNAAASPAAPQIARRCDHDHRTSWDDGGATCPCNLDTLCRFHHRTKTFTAWTADRDQHTNTLTWTSPLGHTHTDQPAPDLPTGQPLNLAEAKAPAATEPGSGSAPDATDATDATDDETPPF
jgi:hypothetical protein